MNLSLEKRELIKNKISKFVYGNWSILIVLTLSLILHILAFCEIGFNYSIKSDDASYVQSGITFLKTGKIIMHGVESAQIMPGLTFFIAFLALLFGTGSGLMIAIKISYMVLALLTIWTVYKTIRLYTNQFISSLPCCFFLVVDYIWMDNIVLTETPYLLLFALLVYHTMKISLKPNKRDYILIVVYYLLAVFIRPNIGIYPLFLFLFLILKKYDFKLLIKQCVMAGLILIIALIPWTIRNYKLFDKFIPLTYGMGNPMLLGTYQGTGYPVDEELDYKTNVDDKMPEEMRYYIQEYDGWNHMSKYYALEYDGMKAKYRMQEWWQRDKRSMLKSYFIYKPYTNFYNWFYWDEILGVDIESKIFPLVRSVEIILFALASIVILIDRKKIKEWLFLIATYGSQIALFSYSFAFSRYAITMFFIRYIIIGIGFGILFDKIKNYKSKGMNT